MHPRGRRCWLPRTCSWARTSRCSSGWRPGSSTCGSLTWVDFVLYFKKKVYSRFDFLSQKLFLLRSLNYNLLVHIEHSKSTKSINPSGHSALQIYCLATQTNFKTIDMFTLIMCFVLHGLIVLDLKTCKLWTALVQQFQRIRRRVWQKRFFHINSLADK